MSDYEVTELTWENGQLSKHGLGNHHRIGKPIPKYPFTAGTLESVVDQAASLPWLAGPHHRHVDGPPPSAAAVEAVVHCRRPDGGPASGIGSCGSAIRRKRARVEESTGTDNFGFATTSTTLSPEDDGGSPETENTSFAGGGARTLTLADDHDSVCHSRRSQSQRERVRGEEEEEEEKGPTKWETGRSISTKRSRAAATHSQSERKRRDKINQRMRTLQKLVPNSSKTDKASMLDEVIEYLKQLQAQLQMLSMMNSIQPMMMPMSMQQFQMPMMAQMAHMTQMARMGLGMGLMDMGSLNRAGHALISPVLPATSAFVGGSPTDHRMQPPGGTVMPDPFSAILACPTQQPMSMDAYQRMVALYQQLHQLNPPPPVPKT